MESLKAERASNEESALPTTQSILKDLISISQIMASAESRTQGDWSKAVTSICTLTTSMKRVNGAVVTPT